MCGGVRYTIKKETFRLFFPNPYANACTNERWQSISGALGAKKARGW